MNGEYLALGQDFSERCQNVGYEPGKWRKCYSFVFPVENYGQCSISLFAFLRFFSKKLITDLELGKENVRIT